jgi:hypothetical protein
MLAQQHLNEEPDLRTLPEGERPVVARALAKDPAKRFPSCLAFVRALYNARSHSRPDTLRLQRGQRPKTMADTMENILLEQLPPDEGDHVAVDLGALPPAVEEAISSGVEAVSALGLTVAQPQTGSLRPTIVIGVGSFGRRALLELRCRFLDRFGDLDKVPVLRFLYLDTDPEAVKGAVRGAPEVAFKATEIQPLSLQPVSHYRRRQLDQLNEWLPREKLYAMPRSLKTQGSRALGRLAFTDHYLRLMARLKREVQSACHPDTIYQTVSQTGLALRDAVPRVYVLGSASGGSSGYLADLGYAIRRLLKQMHQPEAPVISLLFCGAPDDPATPRAEQANLYATLTEINHFADSSVPFHAQYGSDGPRLVDEGPAFDHTYLLTLTHRSPEGRRDAMAHLGSYLFHELTTPLGLRLDRCRGTRPSGDSLTFRSLGTYGVWFPRGLLLRLAARGACQRVLGEWQAAADDLPPVVPSARLPRKGAAEIKIELGRSLAEGAGALLEAARARVLTDPDLQPDALVNQISEAARGHLDGLPREALTRLLSTLEEQSGNGTAQDDPVSWSRQAMGRVREWLGSGVVVPGASTLQQRKSRLTRALEAAAVRVAEEWDQRLTAAAAGLMEHPGHRIALAEAALAHFVQYCTDAAETHADRLAQHAQRSRKAQDALQAALENCVSSTGGFSWFGGRTRRLLRVFMDHLAAFARQCLNEDLEAAVQQFFAFLRGRLTDRLQDLTFCRQRLTHLRQTLAEGDQVEELNDHLSAELSPSPTPLASTESFWESIRESATMRVVLPEGEEQLEQSAARFLTALTEEQWLQLDQALQDQVLAPRGGLHRACLSATDPIRHLLVPLVNQAVATMSAYLPVTDVAEVEMSVGVSKEGDVRDRIRTYHALAAPQGSLGNGLVAQGSGARERLSDWGAEPNAGGRPVSFAEVPPAGPVEEHAFLLIPASESGRRFGEAAREVLPGVHLVNVPGQADLMVCREQSNIGAAALQRILKACRPAYDEVANVPAQSPHARFDIQDWTPLDP